MTGRVGRQELEFLPPRVSPRSANLREVLIVVRRNVTGEQLAQVDNQDPFASPVWRSPVYRTPEFVIWLVQLLRLAWRVAWFLLRHPLLDVAAGLLLFIWLHAGWPGLVAVAAVLLAGLIMLRVAWPDWFARFVSIPIRCRWRWWFYRRHWHGVMTVAHLAPAYRGRVVFPLLGKITVTGCTDQVMVRLVSGQCPADFANRAEGLAHGFRAHVCRVRTSIPGAVVLELVRRDALAEPMPALPIPAQVNLKALAVGRCEDGSPFLARLHGTHLLIAGATGAGKGSFMDAPGSSQGRPGHCARAPSKTSWSTWPPGCPRRAAVRSLRCTPRRARRCWRWWRATATARSMRRTPA